MPIHFELEEKYVGSFVDFWKTKLSEVREQKVALDADEKYIEGVLSRLLSKSNGSGVQPIHVIQGHQTLGNEVNDYGQNWAIHQKISYVLNKNGQPMTTRQIIDELLLIDSSLTEDKGKTAKNISTVLSIKNGDLFERIEEEGQENKYKIKKPPMF